jgi:hypothetical protein
MKGNEFKKSERHDTSSESSDEEEPEAKSKQVGTKNKKEQVVETQEMLRKREELEDSDESVNFSESEEKEVPKQNNLQTKIKNLAAKEALMGKNAKTVVRDKDGQITDLKNSREVRLAEIKKLNQLIVRVTSLKTSNEDTCRPRSSKEST